MLEAKTKAEKELLDKQHKQAMAKLAQQQKYQKELLQQEYDQQKALLNENSSSSVGDMHPDTKKSILDLGYGPISAAKLDQLVASGAVVEYTENGVTKFKKKQASGYKNTSVLGPL